MSTSNSPQKDRPCKTSIGWRYQRPRKKSLSFESRRALSPASCHAPSFPAFIAIAALAKYYQYFFGIAFVTFEYERIEAVEFQGRAAIFRQLETLHRGAGSGLSKKKHLRLSVLEHHLFFCGIP
jgi:hypothetical protein